MFLDYSQTVTFTVKLHASAQEVRVEVPTFSGLPNEDLAVWLDRLRHAQSVSDWKAEETSRIMKLLLRGKASDV